MRYFRSLMPHALLDGQTLLTFHLFLVMVPDVLGEHPVSMFMAIRLYLIVLLLQKPGCVIPGTQQRVGNRKVNGVKSQGHICNAYEVGWQEDPTQDYLCIAEDWNMISGDVCPMGPPQVCSTLVSISCIPWSNFSAAGLYLYFQSFVGLGTAACSTPCGDVEHDGRCQ